ncbi:polyphosphate kinase 2 family protein [Hypericibacter sp.]|uniref:polyphosphate kinase 2 family protein n=1 Tax=Hypericibacter sp. TaxID=2705401 RepID=UPI003D6D369F
MDIKKIVKLSQGYSRDYRITKGKKFRLKDFDPDDTGDLKAEDKPRAKEALQIGVQALSEFQEKLYAQQRWGLLLIFQAMDAAGKDGAIKHVLSGINPQGCSVSSFKAPSTEDLNHDFLWRCQKRLPERGMFGIFNRSYYEEVLVVRVHPEFLHRQKLPPKLVTKSIWQERYRDIRNFESFQSRNGFVIRKFFLYVSKDEQKRRFMSRLDEPSKNWKFSAADATEREHWDEYMSAYQDMIRETATEEAPWYVVPADNKWYTHVIVAAAIIDALDSLGLAYPEIDADMRKQLQQARTALESS